MSISDDSYGYECYSIEFYNNDDGPPLIKKRSRLIATVVQNDVEGLKLLLDSPEWYNVKDNYGLSLLQIAILRENQEVFDYLLSIEDFPLETVNSEGQTAVEVSLTGYVANDIYMGDYYAFELIKKGVNIDFICFEGNTLLHCALERDFPRVARLLLERGADPNIKNDEEATPLHKCCLYCSEDHLDEAVSMLLYYGADPFVYDNRGLTPFDLVIRHSYNIIAQESLFYYTFDEYTQYQISVDILLRIAQNRSPLFHHIIDKISEVVFGSLLFSDLALLLSIDTVYLEMIMEKFDYIIEIILKEYSRWLLEYYSLKLCSLHNLNLLINSRFKNDVIEFISKINSTSLINDLVDSAIPVSTITELICFLLSYGMNINELDFEKIYRHFGYCELFRIFLYMDINKSDHQKSIIPALYYDVNLDIETYLSDPYKYSLNGVKKLLKYCARPKLKEFCYELNTKTLIDKVENLPQVPLLVELARDVFRKYYIKTFQITCPRQFYTKLKLLPISAIHEKIITFERQLY